MYDRWRHRCPRGHTEWKRRTTHPPEKRFYCETCQRYHGDPYFAEDELRDMKQETFPTRDGVRGEV